MKKYFIGAVAFIFTAHMFHVQAEVYRWTDKDGKVHYGDKKPAVKADDISAQVKQQNIDTSSQEHQKLETLFRKENDADREYQRQQAQPSAETLQQCAKARERLSKIDGRVQFLDENGKIINVSETERQQKVAATRKYISENCSSN